MSDAVLPSLRVAVVGSRTLQIDDLGDHLPPHTTEIVSGGAKGIDQCARQVALSRGLRLTEFLPDYKRYGRAAPLVRNRDIVRYADFVLIIWDGISRGTRSVIAECQTQHNPHQILYKTPGDS